MDERSNRGTEMVIGVRAPVWVALCGPQRPCRDRRRPLRTAHLAAELLAAPVVEWLLDGIGPVAALCRLGLGRPGGRSLPVAVAVPALVLLDYPLVTAMTGAAPALRPDWPRLLVGIFAFHGIGEELVWRGYTFRRIRTVSS
jgi:membrane protease YdiL (CAAX protease family)